MAKQCAWWYEQADWCYRKLSAHQQRTWHDFLYAQCIYKSTKSRASI